MNKKLSTSMACALAGLLTAGNAVAGLVFSVDFTTSVDFDSNTVNGIFSGGIAASGKDTTSYLWVTSTADFTLDRIVITAGNDNNAGVSYLHTDTRENESMVGLAMSTNWSDFQQYQMISGADTKVSECTVGDVSCGPLETTIADFSAWDPSELVISSGATTFLFSFYETLFNNDPPGENADLQYFADATTPFTISFYEADPGGPTNPIPTPTTLSILLALGLGGFARRYLKKD